MRPPCSVEGCDKPCDARGWCSRHYKQWQRTGEVPSTVPDRSCAVCGTPISSSARSDRIYCSSYCAVKRFHEANPQRNAVYNRRWRQRHPEQSSAIIRAWGRRNPGKLRMYKEHQAARWRQRNLSRTPVSLETPWGHFRRGGEQVLADLVLADGASAKALDAVEDAIDLRRLIALAPIIPHDYRERMASGDLRLLVGDQGVRFVTHRRSENVAVPWSDFAGPIPSLAIVSAGKMAHRGRRRTRQQQTALMSGRRPSRKQKSDR